jgi:alanyl aminopeptidase
MDPARTWTVPICVRFGAGKQTGRACTVLGEARGELALGGTKPGGCPDWILPNEGGVGYYRTQFEGDLLDRLLRRGQKALTLAERLAVIGDLNALVAAGSVPIETTLGLVASFAKDDNPYIVAESADIVSGIDEVVPPELRPTYQKLIARLYGARVKQLGWSARPGEDDEIKMLRKSLLGLVATKGGDAAIARTATELAWKWLDDRKSVDPELVDVVLSIATYHGDRKLFDRLHEEARKATDRGERGRLLGALAAFTDPELVKAALEIVLTDEFPLRESMALLSGAWKHPQNRPVAYAWVTAHFDDIAGKLPAPFRKYMAYSFVALCDESKKPEIEKTFKAKIEAFDGGERVFSQAMEQLSLCAAKRAAMQTGVVAFLRKHK